MWLVLRIRDGVLFRVHHEVWHGGYLRGVRYLIFVDVPGEHLAQCFQFVQILPSL